MHGCTAAQNRAGHLSSHKHNGRERSVTPSSSCSCSCTKTWVERPAWEGFAFGNDAIMELVPYSQANVDQRALEALNELVQHARKRGIEEEKTAKQMKENINGEWLFLLGCLAIGGSWLQNSLSNHFRWHNAKRCKGWLWTGGDSGKPGSCLLIKNVADEATAEDIARWLESLSIGGRVLSARLHAPTRDMRGAMHRCDAPLLPCQSQDAIHGQASAWYLQRAMHATSQHPVRVLTCVPRSCRGTGEVQFALHDAAPTILMHALPCQIGLCADDLLTLPGPPNIGRSNCIKYAC